MSSKIRIGVLGAGHLGKIHLGLLREIPDFELVGFYDSDPEVSIAAASELGVPAFDSMDSLLDAVDAVDILTPIAAHYECTRAALRNFRHVLVRKPLTQTLDEARDLQRLVREAKVVAMVGYEERYNPAYLAIRERGFAPVFIESHRLTTPAPGHGEVNVVLDLMLHDIDLVLNMVRSPLRKVSASGVSMVSDSADLVNARLEFHNGCVANLTASRISHKNRSMLRVFQRDGYVTLDLLEKKAGITGVHDEIPSMPSDQQATEIHFPEGRRFLSLETPGVRPVNALKAELEAFAAAIRHDSASIVTLEEATASLEVALQVMEKISSLHLV